MKFSIPEMTCGHCVRAIETAIKAADQGATVVCDLPSQTVAVNSNLSQDAVAHLLKAAGYDSTPAAA